MIEQNGIAPGGLNFDAKVRRESTNLKDMFISHVGAMDCFARGLRCAAKLVAEGAMAKMVQVRIHTSVIFYSIPDFTFLTFSTQNFA